MKKQRMYIILFKDGSMMVWSRKPDSKDFQEGSRLFEMKDDLPIVYVGDWIGRGYERHDITEIKEW